MCSQHLDPKLQFGRFAETFCLTKYRSVLIVFNTFNHRHIGTYIVLLVYKNLPDYIKLFPITCVQNFFSSVL